MDLEVNGTFNTNIAHVVGNHNTPAKNLGLLSLPLEVVEYILPHLSAEDIYRLSKVSKQLYNLIFPPRNPRYASRIWRHLNLGYSSCKKDDIQYQLEEGILRKLSVLENTRTLVLDGNRTVTTTDVARILFGIEKFTDNNFETWTYAEGSTPRHKIQILSIRACPRIFDSDLARALTNLSQSAMHRVTGSAKGVYYFTDPEMDGKALENARITFLPMKRPSERHQTLWLNALKPMAGKIIFDTEICQGELHDPEVVGEAVAKSKIASVRLVTGCAGCGVCPSTEDSKSARGISNRALIPPAPLHSSTIVSACSYHTKSATKLSLRCIECIKDRFCGSCGKWWCLTCLNDELSKAAIASDASFEATLANTTGGHSSTSRKKGFVQMNCFECGYQCRDCSSPASRSCNGCHSQYCIIHDHGSDVTHCEWCNTTNMRRRARERRSSSGNMDPSRDQVQPGSTPADNSISMVMQPALLNYFVSPAYPISATTPNVTETLPSAPASASSSNSTNYSHTDNITANDSNATTPPQPRSPTCISSSSRLSSAKLAALYPIISSSPLPSPALSLSGKAKSAIPRNMPRNIPPYAFSPEAPSSKSDPYQTFRAAGMRMRTMMVVSTNKDGKLMHVMKSGNAINGKGQGNAGSCGVLSGKAILGEGASRNVRVGSLSGTTSAGASAGNGKKKGRGVGH